MSQGTEALNVEGIPSTAPRRSSKRGTGPTGPRPGSRGASEDDARTAPLCDEFYAAMRQIKGLFGSGLRSREWLRQAAELGVRCRAMNIMTHLGMPVTVRVV